MKMKHTLKIALSKGRILNESLPLLARINIIPDEDPDLSRKLILSTNNPGIQIIIVRATDVPTYVEYGAADMGIVGKDTLMEYNGDGLYEPLDLKIAQCKMVVAARKGIKEPGRRLRIATKYINTARKYYAERGIQVEIIKLYGSMELAPVLGLADYIVDLVDTGKTLKANNLVTLDTIADISSRVIVNKAAMKMKFKSIKPVLDKLKKQGEKL